MNFEQETKKIKIVCVLSTLYWDDSILYLDINGIYI